MRNGKEVTRVTRYPSVPFRMDGLKHRASGSNNVFPEIAFIARPGTPLPPSSPRQFTVTEVTATVLPHPDASKDKARRVRRVVFTPKARRMGIPTYQRSVGGTRIGGGGTSKDALRKAKQNPKRKINKQEELRDKTQKYTYWTGKSPFF